MDKNKGAYVVVYYANGLLDAETIKLFLESQGLDAIATQESAGITLGLTVGPLGEARVLVPETQVSQALSLIKQMEEGKFVSDEPEDFPGSIEKDSED